MHKTILSTLIATQIIAASPVMASGSGDKYQDAQVGLTYQVWKPTTTANIKLTSFKLLTCGTAKEPWLAAIYGKNKPQIQILETDATVQCSNPGLGVQVATATINGVKAKIVAFCDPANAKQWKNCNTANIGKYGGYAMWNTKPTKNLKATSIEVLTNGLTYSQLLITSRGLHLL